ncbi:MAG: mandelate racemase/muconate lactonizing enzyme family protein [Planctomycetes bacterium]|nr:mandelate racemase/muconate lactonizing enzyme family protein [Planctomycetota bacterium]
MKITRVETAVVEANYDYTYVRIWCDRNGAYGTGECFFAPGLTAIVRDLAPLLIGRDPREVDRLIRHVWRKASGAGAVAGFLYNATSGIEAALWDLNGKLDGLPIYRYLGGKVRDRVRVYADCHAGYNVECLDSVLEPRSPEWVRAIESKLEHGEEKFEPEQYARRAKEAVAKGFDALKFDVDSIVLATGEELNRPLTNGEIEQMAACIRAVREAVGGAVDVAVDCHWRFTPSDAIRIASRLEGLNLLWFEDPCPPEDWRAIQQVKAAVRVPVLTGENLNRRQGFLELLQARAVDLVAPDVQKVGGMLEAKRIGELAELFGAGFAPHNIASPLGLVAAAHVCATLPNHVALEFHGQDVPFWNDLADSEGPVIENGRVVLTERPGLGVELNEAVARRYRRPGEPWFGEAWKA